MPPEAQEDDMIRDDVRAWLNDDLARRWAVTAHTTVRCARLEVFPSGVLDETEEPDGNSWHVLPGTHAPVAVLYEATGACGCDWCRAWRRHEEALEAPEGLSAWELAEIASEVGECRTKEEYVGACLDNSDEAGCVRDEMEDALDSIPHGYFDDEED